MGLVRGQRLMTLYLPLDVPDHHVIDNTYTTPGSQNTQTASANKKDTSFTFFFGFIKQAFCPSKENLDEQAIAHASTFGAFYFFCSQKKS